MAAAALTRFSPRASARQETLLSAHERQARLLLVEDDPTHASLMTERLRHLSMSVDRAATRSEAMQRLSESEFDLVILDMGLPDGSGLEIQTWLGERNTEAPVLFVTSDDLAEHAVEAVRAGAADYVVKRPGYLESMEAAVVRLLAPTPETDAETGAREAYLEKERTQLLEVLSEHEWNVSRAARALGMSRGKLRGRMKKLGLD